MALKIDPASGNPWRGKDNKFAASPFAAAEEADAKMKEALGAKLKEIRAKKAAAPEASERDYFAELPKSTETVNKLKAHRKALSRIQVLEKQRDNATETDKAKRAQRKINRLEKELDPTLPSSEEEAFDLERDIQDAIYRDNSLTNIDPEMTPAEVAKNFDEWVARQPAVALTDDQAIALKRHMNPNRRDVNPDDLVDTLTELPHNDISGLPLSRGTQLGTVKPGDNLKGFAYESFTPDPEVAMLYANAKQLDRSKKPAVITTIAPNGTNAIVPARFDNSQAAQKEVSIGPGYDLIVQDVFDNGKYLEVTAKMTPSSHRQFQPDLSEPADTALEAKDFVMPPSTSLNQKTPPTYGVDKAYYDLSQKRKYVQGRILENGGTVKQEEEPAPELADYDKFKTYAHDQAALWNEIDQLQSDLDSARYDTDEDADSIQYDLEKAQDKVDGSLYSIYEGRANNNLPQEQLFAEEDNGALQDVYFDHFAPDEPSALDKSLKALDEIIELSDGDKKKEAIGRKLGLADFKKYLAGEVDEDGSDAGLTPNQKSRLATIEQAEDINDRIETLDPETEDEEIYALEQSRANLGFDSAQAVYEARKELENEEAAPAPTDNTLLKRINEAEALDQARNDSRNFKPQKTTAADLLLADKSNADLYEIALEDEAAKIPDGSLKSVHTTYLGNYVTQQQITMLQNQFLRADNNTKTNIRAQIKELQRTLPAGVPSYELAERLRAIQYASTHTPTQKKIDEFIKDSKIKEPVYHSTSIGNLGSIISNGFRAGSGEDAYGTGIYFATTEDNARIYNNSRQNGSEQIVAKTYIKSTQPKVLSRQALTEETKKRLGVKTDFELFKRLDDQKATVAEIINEYYAQGYDSVSVRAKDGSVYVIARDPKKLMIGEWK